MSDAAVMAASGAFFSDCLFFLKLIYESFF